MSLCNHCAAQHGDYGFLASRSVLNAKRRPADTSACLIERHQMRGCMFAHRRRNPQGRQPTGVCTGNVEGGRSALALAMALGISDTAQLPARTSSAASSRA